MPVAEAFLQPEGNANDVTVMSAAVMLMRDANMRTTQPGFAIKPHEPQQQTGR
jgi:hypothetical protein